RPTRRIFSMLLACSRVTPGGPVAMTSNLFVASHGGPPTTRCGGTSQAVLTKSSMVAPCISKRFWPGSSLGSIGFTFAGARRISAVVKDWPNADAARRVLAIRMAILRMIPPDSLIMPPVWNRQGLHIHAGSEAIQQPEKAELGTMIVEPLRLAFDDALVPRGFGLPQEAFPNM